MKKKLKIKFLSAIIIGIILLPTCTNFIIPMALAQENSFQNISVQEAYTMIEKEKNTENLVILDVRNTIEYNLGHLYDSILIPLNDLEARISELEDYKTSEIIIYCKSGYRSQQASEILGEYGFTKVYNMLGGILAWIDADYPIWTTSHHITVDKITDKKFELLIEPFLLYYKGCSTCTENQECPIESESISITSETLEQGEDQIVILKKYEFNGTVYEFIHTYTILWSYNKFTGKINKSAYFISTEITSENFYLQYYLLEYVIYHKNYNLTIYTHLEPLNSEIYHSSFTYIKYTPANGKAITSMEFVQFNMSVILSQQYDILADIAEEMAEIYKKSEDLDLMELYYGYTNMGEGIRSLSELVKEQLGEYDYQIVESYAVLTDVQLPDGGGGGGGGGNWLACILCEIGCAIAIVGGCLAGCYFYFPSCYYCLLIMYHVEVLHLSCYAACHLAGCENW